MSCSCFALSFAQSTQSQKLILKARGMMVDGYVEGRESIENLLIQATRIAPYDPATFIELGRYVLSQVKSGERSRASVSFANEMADHALALAPHQPAAQYLKGEITAVEGDMNKALEIYQKASKQFPNDVETKIFEVKYLTGTNPKEALLAAQSALEKGADMNHISPAVTHAIQQLSSSQTLAVNLEKFAHLYPDRWLYHRAAIAYTEQKDFLKAKSNFEKAIQQGNSLESRLQLGLLELVQLGNPSQAKAQFLNLQKEFKHRDGTPDNLKGLVTGYLALAEFRLGDRSRAVVLAKDAMQLAKGNYDLLVELIEEFKPYKVLMTDALKQMSQDYPMEVYPHVALGSYELESRNFEAAKNYFSNALVLSPKRDDIMAARGSSQYHMGSYEEALEDFSGAVAMNPKEPSHSYNRACMLSQLGKGPEAIEALQIAIALDTKFIALAAKDDDLKLLRTQQSYQQALIQLKVLTVQSQVDASSNKTTVEGSR